MNNMLSMNPPLTTMLLCLSTLGLLTSIQNVMADESNPCGDLDMRQNQLLDIEGLQEKGKGFYLGAKEADDASVCAQMCCDVYSSVMEEMGNNAESCNTAVFFREESRSETCYLVHCNEPNCGSEFLLESQVSEESTFVIFIEDFHGVEESEANFSQTSPSAETEDEESSESGEESDNESIEESDQDSEGESVEADDESEEDESESGETDGGSEEFLDNSGEESETTSEESYGDESDEGYEYEDGDYEDGDYEDDDFYEESNENSGDIEYDDFFDAVLKPMGDEENFTDEDDNTEEAGNSFDSISSNLNSALAHPSDEIGLILISVFCVVAAVTASVLMANKVYQHYQRRRLYDKLDYMSQEPLYGNSEYHD